MLCHVQCQTKMSLASCDGPLWRGPLSFHTSWLMTQVVRLLSATKPLSHRGGLEGSGFYDNTV